MNSIVVIVGVLITLLTGIPVVMQLVKGHPRGLFILFFAEMWERFSYYGMRGLLVFFLTKHFLFDDGFANTQYGSYTSLVYLLPLIGGILADRYLGTRKAIAFGALLLVFGHLTMAVEGKPAQQVLTYPVCAAADTACKSVDYGFKAEGVGSARKVNLLIDGKTYDYASTKDGGFEIKGLAPGGVLPTVLAKDSYKLSVVGRDQMYVNIFFLALALIVMGVGFLKANISSIVGQLYPKGDPRRDSGFTLYYYGINLGAFWAAILCGYLGENFGWSYGFGAAGIGMLLGFLVFVLGKPLLEGHGEPPNPELLARPVAGPLNREHIIYLLGLLGVAGVWFLVQRNSLVGLGLGISSIAVLAYVGFFMVTKCDSQERGRLLLALFLVAGSVVFWTLFEQAGTSLNLFADRNTNLDLINAPTTLNILGHPLFLGTRAMWDAAGAPAGTWWIDMGFSAAQTQSFNAGFILIFAPIFAALWAWMGRRGRDPNPVTKFGLGLMQVGLGFLVIVASQGMADTSFRLPLLVLGVVYLLHTTGELCLSPVGLSQITKLAPPVLVSTMMAVWFLSSSWAQFVGAKIAALTASETVGGQVLDPGAALQSSIQVFLTIGLIGIGVGVLFLIAAPFLKHLAHGADDTTGPEEPPVDGERQTVPQG
ncbi:POT family proton-dependent oligopeptide transporter [Caulobacter ginsengisoli]|uniref:POT family proton-dependent oligopeptide transporter n=1 Tax=Caulobacter ginsengisoli TaxID=400775 RepID=A0ABU0IRB9_9CAUL|nr:oligopeptide:H+ symporter [Caulobacter ginsengisoli]MDQ0464562.1 POT family proton-dependent oligopeptide transporter [Caulobacter ginsengisoli]